MRTDRLTSGRSQDSATVAGLARELGLPVSSAQIDQLIGFRDLLLRWNGTYNLTAIRDPSGMLTHHVVDCLAVVPSLRREFASREMKVLDAGSGGGLPGVVLAIMEPQSIVTCVDSVGKKAAFLQQVAGALSLPNMQVCHSRVQALDGHEAYDLVVSRAFASLAEFTRLTIPLLRDSGVWLAMKGKPPTEELRGLPPEVTVFHVEPLAVPGVDGDRCLVWMRPGTKASACSEPDKGRVP